MDVLNLNPMIDFFLLLIEYYNVSAYCMPLQRKITILFYKNTM